MEGITEYNSKTHSIASVHLMEAGPSNISIRKSFTMDSAKEEHSGFTPLIEQESQFGTFKSAKPSTTVSTSPGSLSRKYHNTKTIAQISSDDKIFGLRLLASDFNLRSTRARSTITKVNPKIQPKLKPKVQKKAKAEPVQINKTLAICQQGHFDFAKSIRPSLKDTTSSDVRAVALSTAFLYRKLYKLNGRCKTFTIFRKLPAELRLKVWRYAIPVDRIVQVTVKSSSKKSLHDEFHPLESSPPTVLSVCQEARNEALKFLKPFFVTIGRPDQYIYFDPETDCLKLSLKDAQNFAKLKQKDILADREQVKHLQCTGNIKPTTPNMADAIATLILRARYVAWPCLESVYFSGGTEEKKKYKLGFRVKLPETEEKANRMRSTIVPLIKEAFKTAIVKHGSKANIAFLCNYD